MIFWQEEEDLSLIKLDDVRFDELQSLVNYVLSDYKNQIVKTKSEMIFKDPRLVLYEWDAPEDTEIRVVSEVYSNVDDMESEGSCWKFLSEWTKLLSITLNVIGSDFDWIVLIEV